MRIKRRVAAGFCAVALMAALVAFPLRARAAAALPVIGYAATITAFLVACGIYPFENENGENFGEWGARKLTDLWNTYITEVYPQSEGAQLISDVKSFYANGGYMVMAADTWSRLREFAGWIVQKYSMADNQLDVRVGKSKIGLCLLPVFSGSPSRAQLVAHGLRPHLSEDIFVGASISDVYCYLVSGSEYYTLEFVSKEPFTCYILASYVKQYSPNHPREYISDGHYFSYYETYQLFAVYNTPADYLASFSGDIPIFPSSGGLGIALSRLFELSDVIFEGIMADTSVVQLLDELPEGVEMGGLAVAGAGAGADALEDVIASGVMERQKPTVRSVEVQIGEGTEVDTGTGAVAEETPSVITVTPSSVPLSVSDYSIPGLSGLFPFSIPWDIMRIWQALDAEPRFPLQDFSVTLDIPLLFGEHPPSVTFDLQSMPQVRQKVEDVAGIVRWCLYLVACIGFLVFVGGFIKF